MYPTFKYNRKMPYFSSRFRLQNSFFLLERERLTKKNIVMITSCVVYSNKNSGGEVFLNVPQTKADAKISFRRVGASV